MSQEGVEAKSIQHEQHATREVAEGTKKLEIAEKTGIFYDKMIDLCLAREPEKRDAQVRSAVEELPDEIKQLYAKGVDVFHAERMKNSENMRRNLVPPSERIITRRLLRNSLQAFGYEYEVERDFLSAVDGKVTLDEPIEGLPIVRIDPSVEDLFIDHGLISSGADAMCWQGYGTVPTYIITINSKPGSDASEAIWKQKQLRHETHHYIWKMLADGNFVVPTQEPEPVAEPFTAFRNELAGHIIDDKALAGDLWTGMMIHSDNAEAFAAADEINRLIYLSSRLAEGENIGSHAFLYPVLTARTFDEMKRNIIEITPLTQPISSDFLYEIFTLSRFYEFGTGEQITQLLQSKGINPDEINQEIIDDFFSRAVNAGEVHNRLGEMKNILLFFRASGIKFPQHPWITENLFLLDERSY